MISNLNAYRLAIMMALKGLKASDAKTDDLLAMKGLDILDREMVKVCMEELDDTPRWVLEMAN